MPIYRRRAYLRRRPAYRRRLAFGGVVPRVPRSNWRSRRMFNPQPMFTETLVQSPITFNATSPGNSSYLFTPTLAQIPQVAQYTALYNQYKIVKCSMLFVPAYNVADLNLPGGATPMDAPRVVWAIQDSAQSTAPANESDVLQHNGAKIRMFTKPVRVNFRPVAQVADALVSGGFVAMTRKNSWITTTNTSVAHAGLAISFTNALPISGNPVLATCYLKITFALRDPK